MNTTNRNPAAQTGMEQPQVSMRRHDANNGGSTLLADSQGTPPAGERAPEERAPFPAETGDGAAPVSGLEVTEILVDPEVFNRTFSREPSAPPPMRFSLDNDGGLTIDIGDEIFLVPPADTLRLQRFLEACDVAVMVARQ